MGEVALGPPGVSVFLALGFLSQLKWWSGFPLKRGRLEAGIYGTDVSTEQTSTK